MRRKESNELPQHHNHRHNMSRSNMGSLVRSMLVMVLMVALSFAVVQWRGTMHRVQEVTTQLQTVEGKLSYEERENHDLDEVCCHTLCWFQSIYWLFAVNLCTTAVNSLHMLPPELAWSHGAWWLSVWDVFGECNIHIYPVCYFLCLLNDKCRHPRFWSLV